MPETFQPFQNWRLIRFTLCLLLGFGGLEWRLYRLQVVRHLELRAKAAAHFEYKQEYQPVRGEIRDCCDRPVAMIRPAKNIFINPCLLGSRTNEMARLLASWLGCDAARLLDTKLRPRLLTIDSHDAPIYDNKVCLKMGATLDEWDDLQRDLAQDAFGFDLARLTRLTRGQKSVLNRLRCRTVFADDDQLPIYPQNRLICHLLGLLDHDPRTGIIVPERGLQELLNWALAGVPGSTTGVRDVHGTEDLSHRRVSEQPVDGLNVVLTIDSVLQEIAAKELKAGLDSCHATGAVAIIVRVRTGELLAMASLPDYDMEGGTEPPGSSRNRALQDLVEPGSTFKIVVYAAALNEGLIDWEQEIDCDNIQGIPGQMTDHKRLGKVPRWKALAQSSNRAAARLGLDLGADRLKRYVASFGFYDPTGLGLAGERHGVPPAPGLWSDTLVSRVSIGYGVEVTPLQLVMAMSALANDGRLMQPLLVSRIVDNQGNVISNIVPHCVRSVVTPAAARLMVVGLKTVVSNEGTGNLAQMIGIPAAGKTGTAKVVRNKSYVPGKYRSLFCGFFPSDSPELCVLVMFDEPTTTNQIYYGGRSAAPVFRQIAGQAARYLRLQPAPNASLQLAQWQAPAALPTD